MLINLSSVLSEQHKPIDTAAKLELEYMNISGGPYPLTDKEDVKLHIEHMKGSFIRIQGTCQVTAQIPCDRCLESVQINVPVSFDKEVDTKAAEAEQADESDETDYIDGYHLDVDKLLYNEILIGWPTKVLCKDNCRGICGVCGQNLNEGACTCEDTSLDPRMSVIRDVFKNFKEV